MKFKGKFFYRCGEKGLQRFVFRSLFWRDQLILYSDFEEFANIWSVFLPSEPV